MLCSAVVNCTQSLCSTTLFLTVQTESPEDALLTTLTEYWSTGLLSHLHQRRAGCAERKRHGRIWCVPRTTPYQCAPGISGTGGSSADLGGTACSGLEYSNICKTNSLSKSFRVTLCLVGQCSEVSRGSFNNIKRP